MTSRRESPAGLRDLAVLLEAGLPAAEAFARVAGTLPGGVAALARLRRGVPLADALPPALAGGPAGRVRLAAAEQAGLVPAALRRAAARAEARRRRRRALAGRLLPALAVLVVALVATTLLAMARPAVDGSGPLGANLALAAGVVLGMGLVLVLVTRDAWWWTERAWRFGLQARTPARRAFTVTWLELLLWQLQAGRDAAAALAAMQGLVRAAACEEALARALRRVRGGGDLAGALAGTGLVRGREARAVLDSAERSGRLAELGLHHVALEEERLCQWLAAVDAWLPRLAYGVTVLAALGMFPAP